MLALISLRGRTLTLAPAAPVAAAWASPAAAVVMAPLPPELAPLSFAAAGGVRRLDDGDILAIMADPRSPLASMAAVITQAGAARATSL
jgi:hypothetical protein